VTEYSDEEIRKLIFPWDITNSLFPQQFGRIFWDYHLKLDENNYQMYLVESNSTPAYKPLSDEEFVDVYGEKPWKILNKILAKFPILDYHVNSPEGLGRHQTYEYQLISNSTTGLTINHNSLSSGEKVLMGLISMIFRMRIDKELPKLVLFDEVDSNLHPSMIKVFLEVITETLINSGSKAILVSHSPTTIALAPEESIHLVHKHGLDRLVKADKRHSLDILTEGYATLSQGLQLFERTKDTKLSIITEGRNVNYLSKVIELHKIKNVEVIKDIENMTGVSQLHTLRDFFSKVKVTNKILFVFDCDAGKGSSSCGMVNSYYLPHNQHNSIAKKGIENMFPEHLFENFSVLIKRPNKPEAKSFDSDCKKSFEEHITMRSNLDDFSNFKELIAVIRNLVSEPKEITA
jgi:energy-coupling factor transporter ATP-binding protein EcfA2